MVRAGAFREDLYYRLRGATLVVPPLRERIADLPAMIAAFLAEATLGRGKRELPVAPEAMRLLAAYAWPGNVRELRSEVHRWAVFCNEHVDVGDLAPEIRAARPVRTPPKVRTPVGATLAETVRDAERCALAEVLAAHGDNLSRAAAALAIERNTLKRKLRAFGMYLRRIH